MRNNAMVDLETLGNKPGCAVISIGAVFFDQSGIDEGDTFYQVLDVADQLKRGLTLDAGTLKWWMGQRDAAKKVFSEKGAPVKEALEGFSEWCSQRDEVVIWGKGANFDPPIIEHLFIEYGIDIPWSFRNVRCFRTFEALFCRNNNVPFGDGAHNALYDAVYQAKVAVEGATEHRIIL